MMVVKVYMWPGGDDKRERLMAVGTFTNRGAHEGTGERRYDVVLLKDDRFIKADLNDPEVVRNPRKQDVWTRGRVRGHFPGKRGVWDLLGGGLIATLKARLKSYRTWNREG